MAIAYRGAVVNSANNGGDVALNLSTISGLATGDLVIVAYAIGDNDNTNFTMAIASGTGWTKVADLHVEDDDDCDLGVFWKLMGDPVDTSVTVDGQGGSDAAVAAVAMAFSGVDVDTPLDVATTTATGANSANADPPSIDWSTTGTAVVMAIAAAHDAAGTFTFPTGYTTNAQQRTQADTTDVTVGIGYKLAPSDPENPGAATHSNTATTASWCAATLALRATGVTATAVADTDTGTLTDTGVSEVTEYYPTDTDTGTLAEGLTLTAAELSPYGGTLAESGALTPVSTDTGTLTETGVGAAVAMDTEAGTLADAPALAVTGTDSGAATEAVALATAGEDTGSLGDSLAIGNTGSDTGTNVETGVLAAAATGVDAGTAADDSAIALAVGDVGTLDDSAVVASTGTDFADSDAGALAEANAITAVVAHVDTGALDDTGTVSASGTTPVVVAPAAPSTSYTMMIPRTRDFLMPRASEKWLLREQGYVEITPVAPATPPDPFGWLAEAGDEDFQAVALLG